MTMTFQSHDGHGARGDSVHRHIFENHLAYLNQEETPAKLEQRRNLENIISGFLSMVPHSEKFSFMELSDILCNSIDNNPNFSAYKAGSAFEALEKYATNLISHPWRKEYKTVKLYSGFYKHFVEQQLLGGSAVFHLLGYQYADDGVLSLDEPVDPDKAARVALDCLTAYVECQMMVQICERVKSFKCSWPEISVIRQDYTCGVDEAARILQQLKRNAGEQARQDRWLRSYENGIKEEKVSKQESASYQKTGILVDVSNSWSNNTSPFLGYDSESLSPQSSLLSGSQLNKLSKPLISAKHPSLGGTSSQTCDYQGRNFTSKSDAIDGYTPDGLGDQGKASYSSFDKSNNLCSRFPETEYSPESWRDSWELLNHPSQQSSSYPIRQDSYSTCDRNGHKSGYNSVPNVKEAYNSHFGNLYPAPPLVSFESPSFPYPLPHDFSVPPRQCQCHSCCDHQLSINSNKFQQKNPCANSHCETTNRSYGSGNPSYSNESNELCSSFLKLSLDGHSSNPSTKVRHFSSGSSAYPSYQMQVGSFNDAIFRPIGGIKPQQQTSTKRGSYYDNVPSFDNGDMSFSANGTSLNSKCDLLQVNGTSSSTLKPKAQKSLASEPGNSLTLKQPLKKNPTMSCPLVGSSDSTPVDPKNPQPHLIVSRRDSKGNGKKWSCSSCTFYNAPDKSICDMCGRSRNPGPEIAPLVSGGRECPQCTLVNKKDSEDCTACGTSLQGSPTYI